MNSDRESFLNELTAHIFWAVGEIYPDDKKIIVKKCKDDSVKSSVSSIKSLFSDGVLASVGEDLTFSDFSAILAENTTKKYGFAVELNSHILNHYVLTVYPVKKFNKLYFTITETENFDKSITFISKKNMVSYNLSDILYISYGNHCVEIHTASKIDSLFYISFSAAADLLLKHPNFLRSYKNCIVNMDKVAEIKNDTFVMCNGDNISIPKRRLRDILNTYKEYIILKKMQEL